MYTHEYTLKEAMKEHFSTKNIFFVLLNTGANKGFLFFRIVSIVMIEQVIRFQSAQRMIWKLWKSSTLVQIIMLRSCKRSRVVKLQKNQKENYDDKKDFQ